MRLSLAGLLAVRRGVRRAGAWWWDTFLKQPLAGLVVMIFAITAATLLSALVVRVLDPERALVVRPFQVQTGPPAAIAVTGRTVADGVSDRLGHIVRRARRAARGEESEVMVAPGLRIGVPADELSPIGVHVGWFSFSLESVLAGWDLFRRRNVPVSGDLILEETGLTLRARVPGRDPWETPTYGQSKAGLDSATHELAIHVLGWLQPGVTAHFLWNEGEYGRAIPILREWTEREPDRMEPWSYLAVSQQAAGATAEAIDSYRRALGRDTTVALLANLGRALADAGRLEEAGEVLESAMRRDPDELERTLIQQHLAIVRLRTMRGEREAAERDSGGGTDSAAADADAAAGGASEGAADGPPAGAAEDPGRAEDPGAAPGPPGGAEAATDPDAPTGAGPERDP